MIHEEFFHQDAVKARPFVRGKHGAQPVLPAVPPDGYGKGTILPPLVQPRQPLQGRQIPRSNPSLPQVGKVFQHALLPHTVEGAGGEPLGLTGIINEAKAADALAQLDADGAIGGTIIGIE